MGEVNLVFYPQMTRAIAHYRRSPYYQGERVVGIEEFQQAPAPDDGVAVLGRGGHYHHYDLAHIRLLRSRGQIPGPADTTLVLYDWHEDLDHDPSGTELGDGTWAYLGLQEGLYSNVYVLGVNPRGWNELNSHQQEEKTGPTTEETLRLLDRVHLFPAAPSFYCFKLFVEYERFLRENESVAEYHIVREAGFVAVRFRGLQAASFARRREAAVVSIDLDVLKRSALKADCPQGVLSAQELTAELGKLRRTGPVPACLVCGLTESEDQQDETSLDTLSAILAKCTQVVAMGRAPAGDWR